MKSVIYLGNDKELTKLLNEEISGIHLTMTQLDESQIPASTPLQPDTIIIDLRTDFDPKKIPEFWKMLIAGDNEISLLYITEEELFTQGKIPFLRDDNYDILFAPIGAKELSYRINKQNSFLIDKKTLKDPSKISKTFKSFPLPVFYQDSNDQIVNINPAFEQCFACLEEDIIGKTFKELHVDFTSGIAESTHNDLSSTVHAEYSIPGQYIDKKLILHTTQLEDTNNQTHYTMGVILDITESQKNLDQLEAQKKIAENINLVRSKFLSGISHEFRTPVNAIIGFSELIRISLDPEHNVQEFVETIESSAQLLLDSLNNLLDIAQIEAGDKQLEYSEVCLKTLIHEVLMHFEVSSHKKNIELNFDFGDKLPDYVYLDYHRIKQVLTNLVSNSIKNTNNGKITLNILHKPTVSSKHVDIYINIKDTGSGIAPDSLEQVRKMLEDPQNLDLSDKKLSFGLALSSTFVRMMNGEIRIEESNTEGTTLTIKLPQVETIKQRKAPTKLSDTIDNCKPNPEAKILIADRQEFNRELIKNYLKKIGLYNTYEACTEEELETYSNRSHFDLIIVDLNFKNLDRIDLLKRIKLSEKNHYTPVISLSNNETDFLDFKLLSYTSSLLIKPLSLRKFCNTVDQYCKLDEES